MYLRHLFFIQIAVLPVVKDQLWFSGLSSEVKPLPSEISGSEWKPPASGFRREAAVWFSGESKL